MPKAVLLAKLNFNLRSYSDTEPFLSILLPNIAIGTFLISSVYKRKSNSLRLS